MWFSLFPDITNCDHGTESASVKNLCNSILLTETFSLLFVNFKLVWDQPNYKSILKKFVDCSIKKVDDFNEGIML